MKIHALTVCVNYADLLAYSVERWRPHLASWTLVTDTKDEEAAAIAERCDMRLHRTDVFYDRGAAFNKGAAMEEARQQMPWEDWILFLDADVVPPTDWLDVVEDAKPQIGWLHGAIRHDCGDPSNLDPAAWPVPATDGPCVGFFQLFHATDSAATATPLIDTCWKHAGVYDCKLMDRWRQAGGRDRDYRRLIPKLHLCHLGERDNWFGRGNKAAFAAMMAERQQRGGYEHERLT